MKKYDIVIIGANAAGLSAAVRIKKNTPDKTVLIIEKKNYISYSSCKIPMYLGNRTPFENLFVFGPEYFQNVYGCDVLVNSAVVEIKSNLKQVSFIKDNEKYTVNYKKLLIATGSSFERIKEPQIRTDNFFYISAVNSAKLIYDYINTYQIKKIAIIGAGLIGLEIANYLAQTGKEIILIDEDNEIASYLESNIKAHINWLIKYLNIEVLLERKIIDYYVENEKVKSVITNKESIDCDLVIVAAKRKPNIEAAITSGVSINKNFNAIEVNNKLGTSNPNIYAAGDCIVRKEVIFNKKIWTCDGHLSNKEGRIAGLNLTGKTNVYKGCTMTQIFKFANTTFAQTGYTERQLKKLNKTYEAYSMSKNTKEINNYIKIIYDKSSNKILGASMYGDRDTAMKIDIISLAIYTGMKVEDLKFFETAYNPDVKGVWEAYQNILWAN